MSRFRFSVVLAFAVLPWYTGSGRLAAQPRDLGLPQNSLQRPYRGIIVQGEIQGLSLDSSTWIVELIPLGDGTRQRTMPNPNGTFAFSAVTPGEYEVRVLDAAGREAHQEIVSLRHNVEPLSVKLPAESPAQAWEGGPISVRHLQHKNPGQGRE